MNCDWIQEQLEEYALGMLDTAEETAVSAHLPGCPTCQALLTDYQEILGLLPEAITAVQPTPVPDSLRANIFAAIEQPIEAPPSAAQSEPQLPWYRRLTLSVNGLNARRWRLATAITLLLLLLSLGWGIQQNSILARERAQYNQILEFLERQELILEIIDSADTQKQLLQPVANTPDSYGRLDAYGRLYTRPDIHTFILFAANLPEPPPNQGYQVWYGTGDNIEYGGPLDINKEGFGLLIFNDDQPGLTFDFAQVAIQPLDDLTPV
ncbi:MAG: anti-sigma factor [Chloroflexota bacterium]